LPFEHLDGSLDLEKYGDGQQELAATVAFALVPVAVVATPAAVAESDLAAVVTVAAELLAFAPDLDLPQLTSKHWVSNYGLIFL